MGKNGWDTSGSGYREKYLITETTAPTGSFDFLPTKLCLPLSFFYVLSSFNCLII